MAYTCCRGDLAKLGQLVLDRGRWEGEQVVSEAWIEAATTAHVRTDTRYSSGRFSYGYYFCSSVSSTYQPPATSAKTTAPESKRWLLDTSLIWRAAAQLATGASFLGPIQAPALTQPQDETIASASRCSRCSLHRKRLWFGANARRWH